MARDLYVSGRNWGFRVDRFWNGQLEASYFQRHVTSYEVVDPLGNLVSQESTEFIETRFRLKSGFPLMEFRNPPRSVRELVSQIGAYSDFSATIVPARLDLGAVLENLKRDVPTLRVTRIRLAGVSLAANVAAKVDVQGSDDVQVAVREFVGKRPQNVDMIRVRVAHDEGDYEVQIGSAASLATRTDLAPHTLEFWRGVISSSLTV